MMTIMIKDPEQLLTAAEVLKVAGELRRDQWEKEKAANPKLNAIAWSEQNDPFQFIEPAYRNLVAVAAHIQAIQGKDHGEASMRQIDAMLIDLRSGMKSGSNQRLLAATERGRHRNSLDLAAARSHEHIGAAAWDGQGVGTIIR